jgi:8-oxo-dGTP pyrophosphatase MutT (NUDIX family)
MATGKPTLKKQYAALPITLVDGEMQVLLVTSRGSRRWIIPKGQPEPKLKPHQLAAKEAWEEAGLIGQVKGGASFVTGLGRRHPAVGAGIGVGISLGLSLGLLAD